jgi:hypothetical protein
MVNATVLVARHVTRNSPVPPLLFGLPPSKDQPGQVHADHSSRLQPMTSQAQILSPCYRHGLGKFCDAGCVRKLRT